MLEKSIKYQLRAQAHALKPVVLLGAKGLTPEVTLEIGHALLANELIKVKLAGVERDDKSQLVAEISEALEADVVQLIGHVLTLYRKNPDLAPKTKKPSGRAEGQTKRSYAKSPGVRGSRGKQ